MSGSPLKISAYIPCYNNEETILRSIESIQNQSHPIDEIIVIDDGSSDGSIEQIQKTRVRLLRNNSNLGRGAVRAFAMQQAANELVLCCDATNVLSPTFLADALPLFQDASVAGVFGKIIQASPRNAVERWRGRHLFNMGKTEEIRHYTILATFGAIVRRSAVLGVGNYSSKLRHSEDAELGERLLRAGHNVIYAPNLLLVSVAQNPLSKVLERYWRWKVGSAEKTTLREYLGHVVYSIKVMAREDIQAGDPLSALISLLCPHYQFWKSKLGKRQNQIDPHSPDSQKGFTLERHNRGA